MDWNEAFLDGHGVIRVFGDLMRLLAPVWLAFCIGMVVGWAWKPRWANMEKGSNSRTSCASPSSLSPLPLSPKKAFGSAPCLYSLNYHGFEQKSYSFVAARDVGDKVEEDEPLSATAPETKDVKDMQSPQVTEMSSAVTDEDLEHLYDLVEMQDGGPPWIPMMEKSTADMSYQAWRRDPVSGPPQYCSKTVYENVSPELVRDFFWDDEFRLKWDDMLAHASIIEECTTTGTMVVRWIRKFPFFCSDREYIIARRIWDAGSAYYCVTKGIPNAPVPRHDKPRRVDVYYSSWRIRPVAARSGNGQLTACEVLLFHYEDMGIPWEIAKLGVKQGMWGTVKKIHRSIRTYQKERSSAQAQLSRSAFMAGINTKVNLDRAHIYKDSDDVSKQKIVPAPVEKEKPPGTSIPKLLIFGGAILIACSLDKAILTKAVIFGIGRKLGRISRGV
ncbi:unnamed protein product [Rhodiola kirilowii]